MKRNFIPEPTPWLNRGGLPNDLDFNLNPRNTALLIVDMQYLDAHPDYGIGADAKARGVFDEYYSYYFEQVGEMIPRLQLLLEFCREQGYEVIHSKIAGLTSDCRDVCLSHKRKELFAHPNTKEAEILEELKPLQSEIVLTKGTSSVFNGTAIDQILRNIGIETLIVVGVGLNYCVETTVRDASDRGYSVYLLSDGCAAKTLENHFFSLQILHNAFCKVKTVKEVITLMKRQLTVISKKVEQPQEV